MFTRSVYKKYIENTSWKVLAYGIYARVIDVSQIERVRFLIQKQRVRKYRIKHFPCGIVCIIYILGPFIRGKIRRVLHNIYIINGTVRVLFFLV